MATKSKKKSNKKFQIEENSIVKVSDNNGEITDDLWAIEKITKNDVHLINEDSGEEHKVHKSRVACILDEDGNEIANPDFKHALDKEDEAATKTRKPKKQKQEAPSKVNFAELSKEGEVWSKDIPFDHDGIHAQAHCVIAKDGKSFTVFNTYDGSLGKSGKSGTKYNLTDKKALIRKRRQLEKKNYSLTHENEELNKLLND